MDFFGFDIDAADIKRERQKARELRASQWWKRKCAKGVCEYCGRPTPAKDLTMDHIVPVARGGKSRKGNVAAACKDCNTKKRGMMPLEWEAYLKGERGGS